MKIHPGNLRDLFLAEEVPVDEALKRAFEHALRAHKSMGLPVSSWADGRVVSIPPEKIEVHKFSRGASLAIIRMLADELLREPTTTPRVPGRPGGIEAGEKPPTRRDD
jgi:hypothetical protein